MFAALAPHFPTISAAAAREALTVHTALTRSLLTARTLITGKLVTRPAALTLRDSLQTGCTPALTPVRRFTACTAAFTVWLWFAALSARADTVLG